MKPREESARGESGDESAPLPGRSDGMEFWYSRKQALLMIAVLFLITRVFASVIPPFQSPDEFNHLKRAYLLSHEVLMVGSRGNQTGSGIDTGLLAYMECFESLPFDYGAKVDVSSVRVCNKIHYSGQQRFSDLSNTAMYFPLLYTPQAIALFLGERSGITVSESYYLARLFASCAALALLTWALLVYPVPPSVLALFLMPMCLFQLSSTTLDAMSFATTALAASLFLKGFDQRGSFTSRPHVALALCVLLLATSRIVYIALSLLLLALYRVRKSRAYLSSFAAVLFLSSCWILFALATVHGKGAIAQDTSSTDIIKYYVLHPVHFAAVVLRTLTDAQMLRGYWEMFVGVLGYLDTPLGSAAYTILAIEFLAIAISSNSVLSLRFSNKGHLTLAFAAGASLLLLFLVALSAWTIHPATEVQGIQGRYLYPIAILFLFAGQRGKPTEVSITVTLAVLILTAVSSVEFTIPRLIGRYYAN